MEHFFGFAARKNEPRLFESTGTNGDTYEY